MRKIEQNSNFVLKCQPHSQAHFIFFVPQKIKRACLFPTLQNPINNVTYLFSQLKADFTTSESKYYQ